MLYVTVLCKSMDLINQYFYIFKLTLVLNYVTLAIINSKTADFFRLK